MKLRQADIGNVQIYETTDQVGGTWWDLLLGGDVISACLFLFAGFWLWKITRSRDVSRCTISVTICV